MIKPLRKRYQQSKRRNKTINLPAVTSNFNYTLSSYYGHYSGKLPEAVYLSVLDSFLFAIRERLLTGRKFVTPVGTITLRRYTLREGEVDILATNLNRLKGNMGVILRKESIPKYTTAFIPGKGTTAEGYRFRPVMDFRDALSKGGQFEEHFLDNELLV